MATRKVNVHQVNAVYRIRFLKSTKCRSMKRKGEGRGLRSEYAFNNRTFVNAFFECFGACPNVFGLDVWDSTSGAAKALQSSDKCLPAYRDKPVSNWQMNRRRMTTWSIQSAQKSGKNIDRESLSVKPSTACIRTFRCSKTKCYRRSRGTSQFVRFSFVSLHHPNESIRCKNAFIFIVNSKLFPLC